MKAIILLSGGIDSTVAAAQAKKEGKELHALSFNYGQRHLKELKYARKAGKDYCKSHKILFIPSISPREGNYFPARNTIFLSFALSYAEIIGATEIIFGANADDRFFPDCLPDYMKAFQKMAFLAIKEVKIKLQTPLIKMNKEEIIILGVNLDIDFENTLSCYDGDNCGICGSCKLRLKAFKDAQLSDPITYKPLWK